MSLSDSNHFIDPGAAHDSTAVDPSYAVKLPAFEGPLDLLLHLIRQNEMDITDIQIALIARQYLDYIDLMQELDVDVAAEYLVMAATLALIKSRMLLPPSEEEEEGDVTDPRAELVARLLEYQRFKEVAEGLARKRLLGRDIFKVSGPTAERTAEGQREIEVGLFELIEAFRQVLQQVPDVDRAHAVETENITVRERMIFVMHVLEETDTIEFTEIFRRSTAELPTRGMIVATFLAILELARLFALHLYQGQNGLGAPEGAIRLRRVEDDSTPDWEQRISDSM
jgi:segregation and condensation protein A